MLSFVLSLACSALPIPQSRVIVVVANRLLLSDLDDPKLPTIHKMLHYGAVALVSPNCAGPKTEASVLLTANAGSPCRGGIFIKEFYDADEALPDGTNAGDAYAVRTGRKAPKGSAVFLGLGQTLREIAKQGSVPTKLGALGDALHAAGIKTGVVGNADIPPNVIDRSAAVLAMDSRGIVDAGALPSNEFEATNAQSPPARTGKTSTPPRPSSFDKLRMLRASSPRRGEGKDPSPTLPALLGRTPPQPSPQRGGGGRADFTVICFGDSVRLDEEKLSMSDSAYAMHKAAALRDLDRVLHYLISQPKAKHAILILASFSPPVGAAWDQLTPMVVYPAKRPGLLSSPTTRTPGLIAASDFAPTVLGLMGIPPSEEMIGRAAIAVPKARAVEKLNDMSTRVAANQRGLTPVAVFLVALGALTFTPTALIVAFGLKPTRRIVGLLKIGLVTGSTTFAALLLAVLAPAGVAGYILGTAVSIVALTVLCIGLAAVRPHPGPLPQERERVRALPVVLMYGATALIIVADALTGCNLCKWSGPSSYQITGMRFYGIGNEYAGVLVSMAALAALFMYRRKWLVPAAGVVVVLTLGMGSLGANYGGTAAAVVTFGLLWMAVSRGGFGARHVALVFGLAIAVVIGFAALDWALAGAAGSHAARAAGLAEKLGGGYLSSLIARKVLFNLRITFSMEGLHYALAFVPFLVLWFWGVVGKVREAFKGDARTVAGMKAVLIGAAAAFLLNDSGIIFAGIMIAMIVLVLLYSLLEEVRPCPES